MPSTKTTATRASKAAAKPADRAEGTMTAAADGIEATATQAGEAMKEAAGTAVDAAAKMADAFASSGFGMPDLVRSASERTLTQARDNYARIKEGAEEATDMLEETMETARDGWLDIQTGTLDAAKAHSDAVFTLMKELLGTNSLADAVQLQTAFARERFEAFVDYSKDVQSRFSTVAERTAKPAKAAFEKAVAGTRA